VHGFTVAREERYLPSDGVSDGASDGGCYKSKTYTVTKV
jgi:hypothetical protein